MTALLVVLLCVLFIGIDFAVRAVGKRMDAVRERREREAVLKTAVQLDFASEAKSLKRAEIPNARGRILAVDDEAVILDSFRKILVLAGFSVDTVQTGQEALMLVRQNDYDFVFTDLKMPAMEGTEVVKAVKHLRPDLDVAVITGFGTIETAVETMTYGAVDYVQKPFTEEELVAFANRMLIKRQARQDAQSKPSVRIVAPALAEVVASKEFCVPGGAFVAPGHAWAQIEADGGVCVGLDDFARKAVGKVERIDLPAPGTKVERGDVLFVLRRGDELLRFRAPVGGTVKQANADLQRETSLLLQSPYDRGWVCVLTPSALSADLATLRIGNPVVAWYQDEVTRLRKAAAASQSGTLRWSELESSFLAPGAAPAENTSDAVAVS
jgi:FixJ family two-component response regulator/glycine cleavage system H lipoate-binding protein